MKKRINKIIVIMCILITILPMQMFQALATGIGDSPYLEKGDLGFYTIQYKSKSSGNWYYITYSRTWYTDEQGIRRIAYCVDPDSNGIGWLEGELVGYNVDLNKVLSDARLWRVYRHGYPYVNAKSLGVETEDDAYLATKQAGYWIIRGYNLEDIYTYFRPGDTPINGQNLEDIQRRGKKVIDAIYHLVDLGYNGTETPKYNELVKINKYGSFSQDDNKEYYSQAYTVTSSTSMSGYNVKNIADFPEGSYVANLNGNNQTTFFVGEKFKVMIPKKSINENITGKIEIESKCQNYPVYYGEARDKNSQNYAVTVDSYSNIVETTKLDINAYKSNIKLTKVDGDTKEKLSGVKFNFKYEDGTNIGDYITDKNGEIYVKDLRQGKIIVTELETKNEYILNKQENKINLEYNNTTQLTIENEYKKGNLKIVKVDKDNNSITLGAVEFDLIDLKGNIVKHLVTDVNGVAEAKNINIGSYTLRETATKKEYKLALDQDVTIKWNETSEIKIENEKKKGQIEVYKLDAEDKEYKLEGVEFEVINSNDEVVETIKTDKNGRAITSRIPIGEYKLREIKTDEMHILNDKIIKVNVKEDIVSKLNITNERIKGKIKIVKTSEDDNSINGVKAGSPIGNVKFEVYDSNKKLVDEIVTDENGIAITKKLDKGIYIIKEVKTAKWYLLNNSDFWAEIKENGEVVEINITNESEKPSVDIEKTGIIKTTANQEICYDFKIKNTGNVSLDNFIWYDYLPTECIRITKLATGTYNQDFYYSVYYKTNKNDYRLLKEKLSSSINNYIDFTNLELDDDEYVTEFKVDFGTVDVGFESVINPYIFTTVNSTVKNNDLFTNKTRIEGNNKGYVVWDVDEHISKVYKEEIKVRKLPRTGE